MMENYKDLSYSDLKIKDKEVKFSAATMDYNDLTKKKHTIQGKSSRSITPLKNTIRFIIKPTERYYNRYKEY